MRPEAAALAGYYPLPPHLVAPIADHIALECDPQPTAEILLADFCAGDGQAICDLAAALAARQPTLTCTFELCELEAERARALQQRVRPFQKGYYTPTHVHHTDAFTLQAKHAPADGAHLLLLNPPYNTDRRYERLEHRWLARFSGALHPGGILLFVVPHYALDACAQALAIGYDHHTCLRFPDPDYAAFRQVVLLAHRTAPATAALRADQPPAHTVALLRAWASDPAALPVLGQDPIPPLSLSLRHRANLLYEPHAFDLEALAAAIRPGTAGSGDALTPLHNSGLDRCIDTLIGHPYPVAMPPKPAHVALALTSGAFNGTRIEPDDPATGLPPILLKGTFTREFETVSTNTNKKGEITSLLQVEQPQLLVTLLDLTTYTYYTIKHGVTPTESTTLDDFTMADLLQRYAHGLAEITATQFPALHDPKNPDHQLALPTLPRRLFTAQSHAVQTTLKLLARGDNTFIISEVGTGKCVAPDTRVCINGTVQTIEDAWAAYAGSITPQPDGQIALPTGPLTIASYDEATGTIASQPIAHLWRQTVNEPLRTIRLADGRTITVTAAHKLLTPAGWTNAIAPGSYIAIPRTEPTAAAPKQPPFDARLMAWLIAEGYEDQRRSTAPHAHGTYTISICQKDPTVLNDLARLTTEAGMSGARVFAPRYGRATSTLRATATPLIPRLIASGYAWGQRSATKRIPAFIMRADLANARAFLSAYVAAEGSISNPKRTTIEIPTASQGLAHDLLTLLRRFGIYARVTPKQSCASNGTCIHRTYYRLTISGDAARRFRDQIGCEDARKQRRLDAFGPFTHKNNIETVYVADMFAAAKTATGLTRLTSGNVFTSPTVHGRQPTINLDIAQRLSKLLQATHTPDGFALAAQLQARINSQVFYVKVVSVSEASYHGYVYDLEVPTTHNYVANHILAHNTTMSLAAAAALGPDARARTVEQLVAMGFAGAPRLPLVRRILTVMPPHLVDTWKTELAAVLPGAQVRVLTRIADVDAALAEAAAPPSPPTGRAGDGMTLYLLSREMAKLGHGLEPAPWISHDQLYCPRCGAPVPLKHETLAATRARCSAAARRPADAVARVARDLAYLLAPYHGPATEQIRTLLDGRIAHRQLPAPPPKGTSARDLPVHAVTDDGESRWASCTRTFLRERILLTLTNLHQHANHYQVRDAAERALKHFAASLPAAERAALLPTLAATIAAASKDHDGLAANLLLLTDVADSPLERAHAHQHGHPWGDLATMRTYLAPPPGTRAPEKPNSFWYHDRDTTGRRTFNQHPLGSLVLAHQALADLLEHATFTLGELCDEPLYTATPEPRRYPLARYLLRRARRLFDCLFVDELHEYAHSESAQSKAAHRLVNLPGVPAITLTGSLANGYSSSLFGNMWSLSAAFRRDFGRTDKAAFVHTYGYRKRLVAASPDGRAARVRGYGAHTDREEVIESDTIRQMGEAPGVAPGYTLTYLLPQGVIVHKSDLDLELPPLLEQPVDVPFEDTEHDRLLAANFTRLTEDLLKQIKQDRQDARGTARDEDTPSKANALLGALAELIAYPDLAGHGVGNTTGSRQPAYEIRYPASQGGDLVTSAELLPADYLTPKERWMIDTVRAELAEDRRVMIFLRHTGQEARLPARITTLLHRALGIQPVTLVASATSAAARQQWIADHVIAKKRAVMIVNPTAISTGLNSLVYFHTAIWMEIDYSAQTYRQAIGRLHRPNQTQPVRIYYPIYAGTPQATARELLAAKCKASLQIDGLDIASALEAAGAADEQTRAHNRAALSLGEEIYKRLVGTPRAPITFVPLQRTPTAPATPQPQAALPAEPPPPAPQPPPPPTPINRFPGAFQPSLFDLPQAVAPVSRQHPRAKPVPATQLNLFDIA